MKISKQSGELLFVIVMVAMLPSFTSSITLSTEVLILGMAAIGANLLLAKVGLLSFGQAAFFGVGGYVAGFVLQNTGVGVIIAALASALCGAILATLLGLVSIRRKGIYFVMLTMAFCQLAYFAAYMASDWTGGDNGMQGIPREVLPASWGLRFFDGNIGFYVVVGVVTVLLSLFVIRLDQSPFGTTMAAIRENELRASVVGYEPRSVKLAVFAMSGAITGAAGALHAALLNLVPLVNVSLEMSERILILAILAGSGGAAAALVSASVFLILNDWLAALWPRWMLLLGLILIAITLFEPRGLGAIPSMLCKSLGSGGRRHV